MTDAVTALREMVATQGVSVLDDPRRCRNLLNDLCPGATRDVNVLVAALEEGVPEMLRSSEGSPPELVSDRLTRSLQDRRGLSREAATWAVSSWADALGLEGIAVTASVKTPPAAEEKAPRAAQATTPSPAEPTTQRGEAPGPAAATPWWRRPVVLIPLGIVLLVVVAGGLAALLLRHPNNFPNADERKLLSHIPAGVRGTCSRSTYQPDGTKAHVICTSAQGSVFYLLHRDRAALDSYYADQMRQANAQSDAGNCSAGQLPGDNAWHTTDDTTRGRILCSTGNNRDEIIWTRQDLLISGDLDSQSNVYSDVFKEWGRLGPV